MYSDKSKGGSSGHVDTSWAPKKSFGGPSTNFQSPSTGPNLRTVDGWPAEVSAAHQNSPTPKLKIDNHRR